MPYEPAAHPPTPEREAESPLTLEDLRERAKLTQAQLAKLARLDQSSISTLELGKVTAPRKRTLKNLARALECSTREVYDAIRQSVVEAA